MKTAIADVATGNSVGVPPLGGFIVSDRPKAGLRPTHDPSALSLANTAGFKANLAERLEIKDVTTIEEESWKLHLLVDFFEV